jgi:hypothetical protein
LSLSLMFSTKILYTSLTSPIRATCSAHLILGFITRTIVEEEYRSVSSSLWSFLHSPVTSSLLGPIILLYALFWWTLASFWIFSVSAVSHSTTAATFFWQQTSHPPETRINQTRYESIWNLTVAQQSIISDVFLDATSCNLVNVYWCVGGNCSFRSWAE